MPILPRVNCGPLRYGQPRRPPTERSPIKGKVPLALISLAASLLLVASACQAPEPTTPPLLPAGFEGAQVADLKLDAYAYVDQGEPTMVAGDVTSLPADIAIQRVSFYAAPDPEAVTLRLEFDFPESAKLAMDAIKDQPDLWKHQSDKSLFLVFKTGAGADALRSAISGGKWTTLQQSYPDAWKTLKYLPDNPPGVPAAAGYIRLTPTLVAALEQGGQQQDSLKRVVSALRSAGVDHLAFAAYRKDPMRVKKNMSPTDIRDSGASVLIIARTKGLASLAAGIFPSIAGSMGVQEVTFGGTSASYYTQDNLHILMKAQSNLVYVVASPDKEVSQRLLLSALERVPKK